MNVLSHFRVRQAEYRYISHAGVHYQARLDFGRVDVDAAGNDSEGLAVGQVDIAVIVEVANVTQR